MPWVNKIGALQAEIQQDPLEINAVIAGVWDASDAIVLQFASATDGCPLSAAAILRGAGFVGQLIGIGPVGLDRLAFGFRCGFDVLELSEADYRLLKPIHLSPMPFAYQPGDVYGTG